MRGTAGHREKGYSVIDVGRRCAKLSTNLESGTDGENGHRTEEARRGDRTEHWGW